MKCEYFWWESDHIAEEEIADHIDLKTFEVWGKKSLESYIRGSTVQSEFLFIFSYMFCVKYNIKLDSSLRLLVSTAVAAAALYL